jgi:hypothetical protein
MSGDPLFLAGLDEPSVSMSSAMAGAAKKAPSAHEVAKEKRLEQKEKRLATGGSVPSAGKAVAPAPAPPPPPPEMTPEFKASLLDRIASYRERFVHLKKRNNVTIKSSPEEVVDELRHIEMQLGSRSDGSSGGMMLCAAMAGLEALTENVYNPLDLKLTGLTQVTRDNMGQFQDILDELMIKYGTGFYVSPEMRLLVAVAGLVTTVHAANSKNPKLAEMMQRAGQRASVPSGSKDL